MIETPQIDDSAPVVTAVIRLTIPKDRIQQEMGPAIQELMAAVASQGIGPAGPLYSHHFRIDPAVWDFEVGVPVTRAVQPTGRVVPGSLPAARVARTIYQGGYEGLGGAWGAFGAWVKTSGHTPAQNMWERYVKGPESGPDPATWRTELVQPLAD